MIDPEKIIRCAGCHSPVRFKNTKISDNEGLTKGWMLCEICWRTSPAGRLDKAEKHMQKAEELVATYKAKLCS